MQRKIGNGGTFWVSKNIMTNEGKSVSFYYAWESATPEDAENIAQKFPKYFVLENGTDLWVRGEADGVITLDELKEVISMDQVDSMVLIDDATSEVIAGVKDWADPNDLEDC
ncbi:hypothetical protein IPM62_01370 [Candidatus Woesebacteria bacterium]|nr:MAG: hypothetical protein IPM62_01370 [Candidatus Woesebacteria bacterium]